MSNYPLNLQHTALYLRKSRADLEAEARGEGETLSKHRRALLQLAKKYEYSIDDVYEEIVSGERILERPEMQRLLNAVQSGKYTAVLCMDIDRLGRGNMIDQGLIQDAFKTSNTLIITPRKVYDLQDELDEEWSEFEAFMARRELKIITRRLQGGRQRSAADGRSVSKKPAYGYLRDERLKLYPDPDTAPVVRMIYQMAAQGEGVQKIANTLTDMGIYSPSGREVWDRSSVNSILKNPVYRGHIVWGMLKYRKGANGYDRIKQSKEDWIVHENAHEPLIDEVTWQRYQQVQEKRSKVSSKKELANPLAGILYCSVCGHTMRRQQTYNRPYNGLICKTHGCKNKGARFEIVEDAVIASLRKLLKGMQHEVSTGITSGDNSAAMDLMSRKVEDLQKTISDLQKQKNNLHDLLEQRVYNIDTFLERSRIVGERFEQAEGELANTLQEIERIAFEEQKRGDVLPRLQAVMELYDAAKTVEEKNRLLRSVVERIDYTRHQDWKKPDQFDLQIHLKF